jgi:hypothetical protein
MAAQMMSGGLASSRHVSSSSCATYFRIRDTTHHCSDQEQGAHLAPNSSAHLARQMIYIDVGNPRVVASVKRSVCRYHPLDHLRSSPSLARNPEDSLT